MHFSGLSDMFSGNMLFSVENLVELRKRLMYVVAAVVLGMGISWNFSTNLLSFIEKPLTGHTYLTDLKHELADGLKQRYPAVYRRFVVEPPSTLPVKARKLNYGAPLEPFFVQCEIAMIAGFILALPLVFLQVWLYAAPKLKRGKTSLVAPCVAAASMAFCTGAAFFLWIIWPVIIDFSLSYETEGLNSWFNLSAYVGFCLRLIILFGLIFELPLAALLLSRFGMISGGFLARNRKYALLASAIISAFHADLLTMFVIMVPLYLMYEISVWVAYLFAGERSAPLLCSETPPA